MSKKPLELRVRNGSAGKGRLDTQSHRECDRRRSKQEERQDIELFLDNPDAQIESELYLSRFNTPHPLIVIAEYADVCSPEEGYVHAKQEGIMINGINFNIALRISKDPIKKEGFYNIKKVNWKDESNDPEQIKAFLAAEFMKTRDNLFFLNTQAREAPALMEIHYENQFLMEEDSYVLTDMKNMGGNPRLRDGLVGQLNRYLKQL